MRFSIWRFTLVFLLLFGITGPSVKAQYSAASQPPKLYINSVDNRGEYFEVTYEITAPGYVELHLNDEEEKKLWVTGKVTDRVGVDVHRIPTSPLKAGKRYSFILKYKGKDYPSFFYTN